LSSIFNGFSLIYNKFGIQKMGVSQAPSTKDIHPEDGSCSVLKTVGKPSALDAVYTRELKAYNEVGG
jgi:hypothetical protein